MTRRQPAAETLSVGDPRRAAAGRSVVGTLLVAALYTVYALGVKEVRALYERAPWQDDPYDAVVSFSIFFVPLLAGMIVLRIPLCRSDEPLPAPRLAGLLRASKVALATVLSPPPPSGWSCCCSSPWRPAACSHSSSQPARTWAW